jgi:serine/threonine-protein kinase
MGEVHEAWDTLLSRRVALKSLTVTHAAAILRFMREAQLQARVTHPNVCRIYDVDTSEGVPFIAMQLVRGPNLLQAAAKLSVPEAVEILHAVAQAINAAHRLNLIHRDIKPSNILLEPDGMGGWNTYVADFGLAKDLGDDAITQTHAPMGTPEYMPPEQQCGDAKAMGPAVDVYALGATLDAVLEMSHPGPRRGKGGSLPFSRRGLPRELRTIIERCLEERPRDRYHSAGELAEDLRRFLDGEPLLAQQGSRLRGIRRTIRRHPALAASLGMALLLGAGFGAWSAHLSARGQRQAALAQRFALDARDLENRMRIERLIPIHDMRPAVAQMREALEQIRTDMAGLGPDAKGPGNLAVGRGYQALGDLDRALAALEEAWNGGYTTPEVAYALCKVHSAFCRRLGDGSLGGSAEGALAVSRARHLAASRFFFARSGGSTWEPLALGEAGLLIQERAYAAGLAKARSVFREAPWLYEAKVEEARALEGLGLEQLARGKNGAALSLLREAGVAAQVAQSIGHSDAAGYLVDLEARIQALGCPGPSLAATLAGWDQAERLADQALLIAPDSPQAISAKATVVLGRAAARARAGRDPEPDLRRVERYLAPAADLPELEPLMRLRRRWVQCIRTEFRMARGESPGHDLDWALDDPSAGILGLEALILKARWLVNTRQDPSQCLATFWAHQVPGPGRYDLIRQEALVAEARLLEARSRLQSARNGG